MQMLHFLINIIFQDLFCSLSASYIYGNFARMWYPQRTSWFNYK